METFHSLPEWVQVEHRVAEILTQQEIHGWQFDERAAWELASSLRQNWRKLKELLRNRHPFVKGSEFTPKRNNKTAGYIAGANLLKTQRTKSHITRPYRMDSANISWLEADRADSYWEADYRRDCTEGSCIRWAIDCFGVSEMSRYYEEIGDDLRRHQRLAQAEYDC